MHDLIIVGGGIAGSTLAKVVAQTGASVLLLEREERFRERIRGDGLHVWGTVEARTLGIYELLLDRCAHELDFLKGYSNGVLEVQRDLVTTTPSCGKEMTFFHPLMQETLIEAARGAGVEVWRGAVVTDVCPGNPPEVTVSHDGMVHTLSGRLIAGADGRRSRVRGWGGFTTQRDPNTLFIAGVVVSGLPGDHNSLHKFSRPGAAWNTQFFALGNGTFRCYFPTGDRQRHAQIGGRAGVARLVEYALDSCVPSSWIDAMQIEGPLASFEGASWWVECPYRDGVVLVGDAAAAPDPCFGNGLSLALRDVRVLTDYLAVHENWDYAAQMYAAEHDAYFAVLHTIESWATEAYFSVTPGKQAVRDHAREAVTRGDAPDIIGRGPDQPADEVARRRFLGY